MQDSARISAEDDEESRSEDGDDGCERIAVVRQAALLVEKVVAAAVVVVALVKVAVELESRLRSTRSLVRRIRHRHRLVLAHCVAAKEHHHRFLPSLLGISLWIPVKSAVDVAVLAFHPTDLIPGTSDRAEERREFVGKAPNYLLVRFESSSKNIIMLDTCIGEQVKGREISMDQHQQALTR